MSDKGQAATPPRVLVLGGGGLLGSACVFHFLSLGWQVAAPPRSVFDCLLHHPSELPLAKAHAVVNAAGVVNKRIHSGDRSHFKVNAEFPHLLARACGDMGALLVHISTDCVFSSERGKRLESEQADAADEYGQSKGQGEPLGQALVLRSSFVGPEVKGGYSLLAWIMSQTRNFTGYTDHLWNGLTSLEMARVLARIIPRALDDRELATGVRHVYGQDMDKHSLCLMVARECSGQAMPLPGTGVSPTSRGSFVDRRLRTEYPSFLASLSIPPFEEQVRAMAPMVGPDGLWPVARMDLLSRVQACRGYFPGQDSGLAHEAETP